MGRQKETWFLLLNIENVIWKINCFVYSMCTQTSDQLEVTMSKFQLIAVEEPKIEWTSFLGGDEIPIIGSMQADAE